jgi:hypothetical protein
MPEYPVDMFVRHHACKICDIRFPISGTHYTMQLMSRGLQITLCPDCARDWAFNRFSMVDDKGTPLLKSNWHHGFE